MKYLHPINYFLLFLLLFWSCSAPKEEEKKSEFEFVVTDKFKTFPLPEDIGHLDLYFQSIEDKYFFLFDYKTKQLLTYSIPENRLLKTIKFEEGQSVQRTVLTESGQGLSISRLCDSIARTSESMAVGGTKPLSINEVSQMMVMQVFQAQMQSQERKIEAIENQSRMMNKMMSKMIKSNKKSRKNNNKKKVSYFFSDFHLLLSKEKK
mgnify:CR=1 FL=1